MKLLLGDYHKWFAKNIEDMKPTLELFAYAKFLWDFVAHGVPIPQLAAEPEPEPELEPGPEASEPDTPENEPEIENVDSKGNVNSSNLLEVPVKKKSKFRRSLMKFRGSHEKKHQSQQDIKHLQTQLAHHPETPQTAQIPKPEEAPKKEEEPPKIELPKKEEPAKTPEQIEKENQQLQQLEASMSLLITSSVGAHYERLVFQKRPFKPIGFGNFVDELVREFQSELKYFAPEFERFHTNPQGVAADMYAKLYGIRKTNIIVA
jgi:hypothetical protein